MKPLAKTILSMTFAMGPQLARASFVDNFLLSHPGLMTREVSTVLGDRCGAYTREYSDCRFASQELFRFLDLATVLVQDSPKEKPQKYIVSFKKHLDELKQSAAVSIFLTDLLRELKVLNQDIETYQFIMPESIKTFDLGEFARPYFSSREEALLVLATLFQDMPRGSVQVRYLNQRAEDFAFAELLQKVLRQVANTRMGNAPLPITVFGFPLLNAKIYHFLVPAAVASHLRSKGVSARVSMATGFIFNYLYEAKDAMNPLFLPAFEPSQIKDPDSINDVLAGELGARLGAGFDVLDKSHLEFKKQGLKKHVLQYMWDTLRRPWLLPPM